MLGYKQHASHRVLYRFSLFQLFSNLFSSCFTDRVNCVMYVFYLPNGVPIAPRTSRAWVRVVYRLPNFNVFRHLQHSMNYFQGKKKRNSQIDLRCVITNSNFSEGSYFMGNKKPKLT